MIDRFSTVLLEDMVRLRVFLTERIDFHSVVLKELLDLHFTCNFNVVLLAGPNSLSRMMLRMGMPPCELQYSTALAGQGWINFVNKSGSRSFQPECAGMVQKLNMLLI